jgi:hypothetical protein
MVRRPLYIPAEVQRAIEAHITRRLAEAQQRYWSASEDEDTFTGHLGALLGSLERRVRVDGRVWRWEIEYTKFRGKGAGAAETSVGADGILEIRLRGPEIDGRKAVLFQAKMGTPAGRRAFEQALVLSNWREAAVFFGYDEDAVKVYRLDDVIRSQGGSASLQGLSFPQFFSSAFLACTVGDSDLSYVPQSRTLQWRDDKGVLVGVKFSIPHRIRVSIKSPWAGGPKFQPIGRDKIGEHRMGSTAEERMGLAKTFTDKDFNKVKREIAKTYHPDALPAGLDDFLNSILHRRMTEFNDAFAEIRRRTKKKE